MGPKLPPQKLALPAPPEVEEDPLVFNDGTYATVLTVNDRMCRWPIGDPQKDEFHFCGKNPMEKGPYCEAHARKAHQAPSAARNDKERLVSEEERSTS